MPGVTAPGDELGMQLQAVAVGSPSDAWAVGNSDEDAATVTMRWNGTSWTQVSSPNPANSLSGTLPVNQLDGVAISSANSIWAVGNYANQTNGVLTEHNLVLHGNGTSWTQVASHDAGTVHNDLRSIAAGPGGVVWAAGFFDNTQGSQARASAAVFGTVPSVFGDTPAAAADAMANAGLASNFSTTNNGHAGCNGNTVNEIVASSPAAGSFTAPPVTLLQCSIPGH